MMSENKKPEEEPSAIVEEAPNVEKQRFNKNRNVAKQDTEPNLSQRYGPHYIKTTFLMDRSSIGNQPSNEELNLCTVYSEIAERYSSIDWKVNNQAIAACSMTTQEKKLATMRSPTSKPLAKVCSAAPKPMQSRELLSEFDHVQIRRKKRVLVPISGGISSLATLWWCLLQDFDIYLCYCFDSLSRTSESFENSYEIQCLLRLLQYARKKDGTLLFESVKNPQTNVFELTRAEIQQRIRVVQVPMPCYYFMAEQVPVIMTYENSLKAHPQAYLLFYRHLITVAQSLSCSAIALGMFGDGCQLLNTANCLFNGIHQHELIFPFQTRQKALETFQEACEKSWFVWKSFLNRQEETVGVWQTAGPSLLPNASHYVTTCNSRPPKDLESQMIQAQERALEKVQDLIAIEMEKEQEVIDDATARGEKMRKKRAIDPFQHAQYLTFFLKELESVKDNDNEQVLNFCNRSNCVDCAVWSGVTKNWNTKTDSLRSKWQNLASEYCARLKCNIERKQNVEVVVSTKTLKKRELTIDDVVRPAKKPKLNEDDDVDDKNPHEDDEEEEEEEEEEDPDFEEEEEEDVPGEAEEDDENVILVEDEEDDGGEEEEEAGEEEEEKEKEDDEDEEEEEEEEEEEDEEDDGDDEDDNDGDEDY